MQLLELGDTGVMVPELGLGTWRYHGGAAPLIRGIELGANLIDTAEIYGSEPAVAEAIRGLRDKVFVATKVSGDHLRYADVLKAADGSLKRLGIDVIDLYQVHWPDDKVPIDETVRALEALVDAGKVRFIGVSNFSRRQFEAAQAAMTKYRIVANQLDYNLEDRSIESDMAAYYRPNKVTVIAYSPLGQGQLLQGNTEGRRLLRTIAAEIGKTPAQVAINWTLTRPGVITIPKTDRVERVDEDVAAAGWRLSREQVERLEAAFPAARQVNWSNE